MRPEPTLRIHPRFTHLVVRGDSAVLVGDGAPVVFDDPRARDVLRTVDGHRTAPQVARALEDVHEPALVHFVLLQLLEAGVAEEVTDPPDSRPPHPEGAPPAGAQAAAWVGPGGCTLRLVADYLAPEVGDPWPAPGDGAVPRAAPILLASVKARQVWVGPLLGPEVSCPVCLQDRLRLNLTGQALVHDGMRQGDAAGEVIPLPSRIPPEAWDTLAVLLPTTPQALAEFATTLHVAPLGSGVGAVERHPVPRLPHCPACGDPGLTVPGADVTLRSRPRSGRTGGGYRTVSAGETLARWSHLVSPLTGVVRHVSRIHVEGTELVHVYTAGHAHHYGRVSLRAVRDGRRDHSGGKGRTDEEARASALCESLERFSSVHRGDEPCRVARLSELGEKSIPPNALMHFSPAQFAGREAWNREHGRGFQAIPEPYADEPMAWSPVRSLATGATRLVPSAFLYYGFRGRGDRFCDGDSNGLAGGNCLEEAILQGFLEVVERDAVALWWYTRALRPAVELSSADDPWIQGVVAHYDTLGRDVWALDLTTDLGIPAYAAVSARRAEAEQDIIFGFGAHLDPGIALGRALTEVNQMLPTVLEPREERRRRLLPDFPDAVRWWDEATLASDPYLAPAPHLPSVPLPTSPSDTGDLHDDIEACVRRARAVGCDVLVHDLTRPDVGFPVAKVVVPGLRHFWRRLGPGRLYEVPVALGWVPGPVDERKLNPVSLFV